jgi:GAF domain-containing protein
MTWAEMRELLHEDDREPARIAVERAAAERSDYDIEYRVVGHKDGETRWVLAKGRGLYDDDGRVTGMLGVVQDMTGRKLIEQALREQTEALSIINELGQVVSAELDLHNIVQAVTDAATELTGAHFGSFFYNVLDESGASYMLYTLSGVRAKPSRTSPCRAPQTSSARPSAARASVRIDDVHLDPRYGKNSPYYGMPEGHLPVTSYLAVPVISRSGESWADSSSDTRSRALHRAPRDDRVGLSAQAAVAMDNARLYETVNRERAGRARGAENERLYREAQEANRLKDEFLATLSHELRTPLTAILGWAHMLRTGQFDDERRGAPYETIERNARAQAQLIDDLLDVSRIITGKLRLDVRPVDPLPSSRRRSRPCAPRPRRRACGSRRRSTRASAVSGDPVALAAGRLEPAVERHQVHAARRACQIKARARRVDVEITVSDTGQGIARVPAARLRPLPAGRPEDDAAARRARARASRSSDTSSSCTAGLCAPRARARGRARPSP